MDSANESAELAAEIASRIRESDEDGILAAEAFSFGMAEEYLRARQADLRRRLQARYGEADTAGGDPGEAG